MIADKRAKKEAHEEAERKNQEILRQKKLDEIDTYIKE